jgi:hypothetical protein
LKIGVPFIDILAYKAVLLINWKPAIVFSFIISGYRGWFEFPEMFNILEFYIDILKFKGGPYKTYV